MRNFGLSKKRLLNMKKGILIILSSVFCFCGCQKVLYTHYNYDELVYFYAKQNKNLESKDIKKLVKAYEKIVANPKGENNVPPPGAFADYAYLLFLQGETEKAKEFFQKEYVTYPESKTYVESLMQKLGL